MRPSGITKRGFLLGLVAITLPAIASQSPSCRCLPGDACWPSTSTWNAFNQSIDGLLMATVPLGTPCHAPNFDEEKCKAIKDGWLLPDEHYKTSSSIMAPYFGSCDPFYPSSEPCPIGNLVQYAVNVSKPEHIIKTLEFTRKYNIRFIVRNTGHDYQGKSTGAGALAVWMHNLKDIEVKNWSDAHYTGKAAKLAAGVQGIDAFEAAHKEGLRIVGGECPSVGLAGGYSQGGGHSALSSRYGLGADQILEWEVIDGTGRFLIANREQNADLYWALAGGGAGTYGIVWSMTSKAHPDGVVSGLNLTFSATEISTDTFFQAVELYNAHLSSIVDEGVMSLNFLTNTSFTIAPMTGPDIPLRRLESLFQPVRDGFDRLGIHYTYQSEEFDSYLAQFRTQQAPIEVGIAQYGGWLVPRSVVQENNSGLTESIRSVISNGGIFTTVAINVSKRVSGDVHNAVLPAWREAIAHVVLSTSWEWDDHDYTIAAQEKMTNDFMPSLMKLAPKSGAYLNEADFRQPDFKTAFYGENYDALRQVKAKYDPHNLFYGLTAVGSDEWTVSSSGRMCPVVSHDEL
ncbi:FAD binding domain protein [Penicillium brasilianum]|uniref:FAD binding domain protein n=1 Tax=Penicillium brasilianum TaxID=104259 RepID=A0A1S9RG35_PENBI|nr:FAD binding domain protein [Penicillium brasilianum]